MRRRCAAGGPERELRAAVLRLLRDAVPFEYYVWVTCDPVTAVGAAPLAEVPVPAELPRVIRTKYLNPAGRWTSLPTGAVRTLAAAPVAGPRDRAWRDLLHGHGVTDVASAVLRDRAGTWGFLDLWRRDGRFGPGETELLAEVLPDLTGAVRAGVAASFRPATGPAPPPATRPVTTGPAVLMLSGDLVPGERTRAADATLRALLPTPPDRAPVPAAALNAGAQLLAVEAGIDPGPPSARLPVGGGRWVVVRAARLGPAAPGTPIVVTVGEATAAERLEVYARAIGLTPRETLLVERLLTGADTRAAARALGISEHTVQDHLRSVFAKSGTSSRGALLAHATG